MIKRYFELSDPYYALIKASTKTQAKFLYQRDVAGLEEENEISEDNIKEVGEHYALVMFSRVLSEDGKLDSIKNVLEEFEREDPEVMIYDGTLM